MNISGMERNHALELVVIAALTPMLALTRTTLGGFLAGIVILVVVLLTASLVYWSKSLIPHRHKWLVILLISSTVVAATDRILLALSPDIHLSFGIYLPLLAVVPLCSILPAELAFTHGYTACLRASARLSMLLLFFVIVLGCLRELLGTGGVFTDARSLLGTGLVQGIGAWQAGGVTEVPGALLLAGLLLALIQYARSE